MSILKKHNRSWLPLAVVPLFSMAVLVGCGSDSDDGDDGSGGTNGGNNMVVEVNENNVPVAFLAADGSILPEYAVDIDTGTDSNTNGIEDSFEATLTGGNDANTDGIDDDAFAALSGGGVDPDPDGGEPDPDGGEPDPDGGEPDPDPDGDPQTGNLNTVVLGSAGNADLNWDGSTLTGQVNITGDVPPASAGIYSGIFPDTAGTGQLIVPLNSDGNPSYFVPTGMNQQETTQIAENIVSGNLYISVDMTDGTTQGGPILLNGVQPKFTELRASNNVPAGTANSTGQGYINLNTLTGDFTARVTVVNLNPSDVDADGNPQAISMAHIHRGGPAETGGVAVELLNPSGDTVTWLATGTLSNSDLELMTGGNMYFNVHGNGGVDFIRGQIPSF